MEISLPPTALFPVALFLPLLLMAFAVRSSGRRRILSSVDYPAVLDPAALHRWVGNRLLLMPAWSALATVASVLWPTAAVAIVVLFFLALVLTGIWVIGIGASRFAEYGQPRSAGTVIVRDDDRPRR